jgi:branched-chain amino acid transport system permease protein
VALLAGIAPLLSIYGQHIFVLVALYGSVALAWNILGGMAGQMSLGHALFVGAGAYVSTALYLKFAVSPWIGLIVAAVLGAGLGALMGYTVFRRKLSGVYFALVTLALAEIALHIVSNVGFLGAANGLAIPSKPDFANFQFGSKLGFCYAALGVLSVVSVAILAIDRSRLGYVFLAIRENERSAADANYVLFIDPESVLGVSLSIDALLFSFVGGLGSLFGPLLGAVLLVPLTELLRSLLGGKLAGVHLIVYGVILILVMRLAPQGLWGLLSASISRRPK